MTGYKVTTEVTIKVVTRIGDKTFTATQEFEVPNTPGEVNDRQTEITKWVVEGFQRAFIRSNRAATTHWQKLSGNRSAKLPRAIR